MSPELERLMEALCNLENAAPAERAHYSRGFQDLVDGVLSKHPSLSRDAFMRALRSRYPAFRRARRRLPTMPPKA